MADTPAPTLYQFRRAFGVANPSPFCMKVECWLRMAGLEYAIEWVSNPARMPRGKCPALALDGELIADSTLILDALDRRFAPGLDDHLDATRLAVAHAFSRMLEERTYWVLVYSRWMDPAGWPRVREQLFGTLPPVIRSLVARMARRTARSQLLGHGLGRHDHDGIYALGARDLRALADWLAEQDYFLGDRPSSVDATVYAFVANALQTLDNPLAEAARGHANLAAYCERMRERYFADL